MPLGVEVGLGQGHILVRYGLSSPPEGTQSRNLRHMSIVAKRLLISATAEHLLNMRLERETNRHTDTLIATLRPPLPAGELTT